MTSFWSTFIIVLTVVSIVGIVWLLIATARSRPSDTPGESTTGHVWDEDLAELNNPLPRWWLGLFLISIVFSIGYLTLYPGMGSNVGTLGWTSRNQLERDLAATNAKLAPVFARFANRSVEDLSRDAAATKFGRNVFVNNCAACHGSDARGAVGFPNLTDSDWLYGGGGDHVLTSVVGGRAGVMPPLAATLPNGGVAQVANYVRQLSGQSFDSAAAVAGKAKFESICAACHGADGKGNVALGAPNLTDDVWLYGGSFDAITETITYGRQGRMPAWAPIIGEDRARLAAAYVLSLSAPSATTIAPNVGSPPP